MGQPVEFRFEGLEIFSRPADLTRPWGLFFREDGFQGWGGLPAGRRESLARAVQHGEHDTPVYLPSRVITVDGQAIARTEDELQIVLDLVAGAGATGERARVSVTRWDRLQWADGRRVSVETDDKGQWRGPLLVGEFQLQVVCADPRKYGDLHLIPETGTGVSLPVLHYGTFPAFPVVEIPSAPSAYSISSPAGTFVVSDATPGGLHAVDMRSGQVRRNGVVMPRVGRGPLWAVPPGVAWTHALSTPGRVRIADTFV